MSSLYSSIKSAEVIGDTWSGVVVSASGTASATSELSQSMADNIAQLIALQNANAALNSSIQLNKLSFTPGMVYSSGQQNADYAIVPLYSDPSGTTQVGTVTFTDNIMNIPNNYVITEKAVFSILDTNQTANVLYEYTNVFQDSNIYWANGTTNDVKILYGYGITSDGNDLIDLTGHVQIVVNNDGSRKVTFTNLSISDDMTLNGTYYYLYSDFANYSDFYYSSNN